RPASGCSIVIARPEANEFCVLVVEAARKPEGLKSGVGVIDHVAELVVVHALGDLAVGCVHNEPGAAQVIKENSIGSAALHQVVGTRATTVNELAYELIVAVELGDGVPAVVQETVNQN